jgi:uncharacterized Zn-binding protein involved in type VI secretion
MPPFEHVERDKRLTTFKPSKRFFNERLRSPHKSTDMTKRYDLVQGDKTTTGATILNGDSTDMLGDREQAYENDAVACPVCKTIGRIVCVGPRHSMTSPDGREAALSDDICLCNCIPGSHFLPSQYTSYMDV